MVDSVWVGLGWDLDEGSVWSWPAVRDWDYWGPWIVISRYH